ncbi:MULTISPECIES: hypothetical protein [unclassified Flavobacterium]|jgi:hypothetical protein|uniref:hypothetical protein n=1 Tax=unclassified Flavobacterium TaxID=196869 RepID=UPI00057C646E|nr:MULTISPECIES: hypothetical protein [unclassified Flavobacterium]KIA95701.1 hypothetical protein OA93_18330 [Flavobacterium sp. KMS]KIC01473.1 hypothetical protein OA88_13845 [Flavobacterium sp. JRM]OUL63668.1 hypothetical protein B8T70_03510 [Flavobacterium sp. AJR]
MKKIQVGFLVSYDYSYLKTALPQVYKESDSIFLAIDKERKTWKGESFIIEDEFFQWIKAVDVDSKIQIIEENFYCPELNSMECEVRERKILSEKMGIGNWLIQLDCDEYFLKFKEFVAFLRTKDHFLDNPEKNQVQISPYLINLYKRVDSGMLYVEKTSKVIVATNYPSYKIGRRTRKRVIYYKGLVLHECVSRSKEELEMKFSNWGHDFEINKKALIEKWESVNENNYKTIFDFYYLEPERWKRLEFVKGTTFEEIKENLDLEKIMPTSFFIWKKNFGQWFKDFFV